MSVNFEELKKMLAENKVYNAWQYVNSLLETTLYMNVSYELLQKVYEHYKAVLNDTVQKVFEKAVNNPGTPSPLTREHLTTNLNIAGYKINDIVFLRKTTIEFFHYARISMDILIQITNAALLGDGSVPADDRDLLKKVLHKLEPEFFVLHSLFESIKNEPKYEYLLAFDNYLKHIKTILVRVEKSIILGDKDEFIIDSFVYKSKPYPACDAISKVTEIYNFVNNSIDRILEETKKQTPNAKMTEKRIQSIHFEQFVKKDLGSHTVEGITFFIDVNDNLSELPTEISVYPLIVKPNGEVYSFDFKFKEIFIRRKRADSVEEIIGCAKIKNGFDTNEFYRIFKVEPCDAREHLKYLVTFSTNYPHLQINYFAMDGQIIYA